MLKLVKEAVARATGRRTWQQDAEQVERYRKQCFQQVFSGPEGQFVLQELAEQFYLVGKTLTLTPEGRVDPHFSFYHEGQRAAILWLLEYVESPLRDFEPTQEVADHD